MTLCDHSGLQSWAWKHLSVMGKVALSHCGATEANERERHKLTDPGIAGLNKYWSIKRANWGNYLCDQRYIVLQTHQEMETNERQHTQTLTSDSNVLLVVIGGYLNPSWRQTLAAMTDPSDPDVDSGMGSACCWELRPALHGPLAPSQTDPATIVLHPSKLWNLLFNYDTGTLWCMLRETL